MESKRDEHVQERFAASLLFSPLIAGRAVSWKPGTPGTVSPIGSTELGVYGSVEKRAPLASMSYKVYIKHNNVTCFQKKSVVWEHHLH